MKDEWIMCPICGNKTRNRIKPKTILINFPLYCPKCKKERKSNFSKEFTSNSHQRARRRADELVRNNSLSAFAYL